jgi:hypothetical protein
MELKESGKGKETDRASVILHTIPYDVEVQDIRMCIERC